MTLYKIVYEFPDGVWSWSDKIYDNDQEAILAANEVAYLAQSKVKYIFRVGEEVQLPNKTIEEVE